MLRVGNKELYVNLVPLDICDFDIILGVDLLASYHASIDCFKKEVVFHILNEPKFKFCGDQNVSPDYLISALKARKLTIKGSAFFLAHVIDISKSEVKL